MPDNLEEAFMGLLMPSVDLHGQQTIHEYLSYMHLRLSLSLNEHEAIASDNPSKQLRGQIAHFNRQLSIIDWLISVNKQRKVKDANSKSWGGGI